MPRRQRELSQPASFPTRSIVASSVRYNGKTPRIYVTDDRAWQTECYRHYRICGEARFAAKFFGNALSKATLYVTNDPYNPKAARIAAGPEVDTLHQLFNGSEGQAAMLSSMGTHLTIAGECYLIGREDPESGDDIWEIRSVLEVQSTGSGKNGQWYIQINGQPKIPLREADTVIRIWMPDPENSINADSPFRSLLPILAEIEWLTRYVFAQATSRLAGAGIWLVDEDIEFPEPPQDPTNPRKNEEMSKADKVMAALAEAMLKPLEDPGNPAAKVPIVATVPGDSIEHMKDSWITFWSELDSEAKELRQEAIGRFALGMDLPPERVLGMGSNLGTGGGKSNGVSHWGSWQIDEDTIKMHIEPMLEIIVQVLTVDYERPALEAGTPGTLSPATVRYDTTDLRLRPDRSKETLELWNLGLIKAEVVLRENRFDPEDQMDEDERKTWLLCKVATGSATPDMVNAALNQLGVSLGPTGLAAPDMNEGRPPPSLEDHPVRELPNPEESEAAGLLAACDALVYRALERAGNRLRQTGVRPPGLRAFETHTAMTLTPSQASEALVDAWSCAPQVLAERTDDIEGTTKKLHAYAVGLLTSSTPHSRDALARWMTT